MIDMDMNHESDRRRQNASWELQQEILEDARKYIQHRSAFEQVYGLGSYEKVFGSGLVLQEPHPSSSASTNLTLLSEFHLSIPDSSL